MANIVGKLTNSVGTTLGGSLTFTLLQPLTDESTSPDTIRLPVTHTFTIDTDGVIDIDVPESATYSIPYRIVFTRTGADTPSLDFYSIVPNVGTVEFSLLVPTGITNASLDTGALRVAQLLTNDPVLAPLVKRPIIQTFVLDAETSARKFYIPKAFSAGAVVNNLNAVIVSGAAGWTFAAGQVTSAGADIELVPALTSTNVVAGRTYINITFGTVTPSTALAYYVSATPGVSSTAINGSLAISLLETVV